MLPSKFLFPLLLAVAFAAGIGVSVLVERAPGTPPDIEGLLWPEPRTVGAFSLRDQRGRPFGQEQLADHWTLLFFGYTYCPDVCPVTLAALAEARALLEDEGSAEGLQVAFVSVDPERDSAERLGEYVEYFSPDFIGVTGDEAALDALTRQLGVIAFRTEADPDGSYLVDHTTAVLLVDPQARLVGIFRSPHEASDIAARVRGIREFVDG